MLTDSPLTVFSVVMGEVHKLDSKLMAFWEGFPCPPPWNQDLFFRLNWTGCMEPGIGEKVKYFMADKCKIPHLGLPPDSRSPGGSGGGQDGVLVDDTCGLPCQIIIAVVSFLFIILLSLIVVVCVRRQRAKSASPSHQSALTAHADGTKYYTSCHYACTTVMPRQLQTTLQGTRTETALVPSTGPNSPANSAHTPAPCHYYPGSYPQVAHDCHQLAYHQQQQQHLLRHLAGGGHHAHHAPPPGHPPRLINTPYGPVPAHTSSLVVPRLYAPCAYRKLDGVNYSGSSCASDRSPVYETIDDTDSTPSHRDSTPSHRESTPSRARDTSQSECEFCKCGDDHCGSEGDTGGGGSTGYASYDAPIFYKTDQMMTSYKGHQGQGYHESASASNLIYPQAMVQSNEDPPGPAPMYSDHFYGDEKMSQTLPLRPMKKVGQYTTGANQNGEMQQLNPGKAMTSSTQSEGGGEGSMRRRPSSGGSSNGGHYREANYNGQRRPVPALHPNYFSTTQDDSVS